MDQPTQTTEQVWPERPLEDYLAELRETGFTVLDNLVDQDALARIVAATDARIPELDPAAPEFDGRFGVPDGISWSQDICHAVTHPAALWVMRTYLQTDGIRFCHQPAMTVLRPAKDLLGEFPEEGWHADYPYHPDVYPDDRWRDETVYGVQFNLCIDDFTLENGATQYVPGSHLACRWPPRAFNEGGTRMGVAPHDEVVQMVARAGAALIYDSRTWHRACPELNASGKDRRAILNAVCPDWVRSMVDKTAGTERYRASGMADQLPESVSSEIERLCHDSPLPAPNDAPVITEKVYNGPRKIQI